MSDSRARAFEVRPKIPGRKTQGTCDKWDSKTSKTLIRTQERHPQQEISAVEPDNKDLGFTKIQE